MSNLAMTPDEQKDIDTKIERMMDWARTRKAEADQLALDSARLMACTEDRLDRIQNQGFFKRCWYRFSGKAGEMERANVSDLIQMQKAAFRYVNMLEEQQMLTASALLSLKNNLNSIAAKEEETRKLITMLAQNTLERFEKLENRVDQLEISSNLQGWVLTLEEREYERKYPTEFIRLFKVINDFYRIIDANWNYNDLMFMRKAIRTVGLNPSEKISLNCFINKLIDEIQTSNVGFKLYNDMICEYSPQGIENYSKFVIDNISSPVLVSLHELNLHYIDKFDVVQELQEVMNISINEALKHLIRRNIENLNINMNYEITLADIAVDILVCLRIMKDLITDKILIPNDENIKPIVPYQDEVKDIEISEVKLIEYVENKEIDKITYLLSHGINPNCFDKKGESPLMKAAKYGDEKLIKFLIQNGAIIDLEGKSRKTAFWESLYTTSFDNAKLLLELGANINHIDAKGYTPLMLFSSISDKEIVDFLLDNGADINFSHNGKTALIYSINQDNIDIVDKLLSRGASVNHCDDDGWTPLNYAIFYKDIKIFEKLLSYGARLKDYKVDEYIYCSYYNGFLDWDKGIFIKFYEIAKNIVNT